MYEECKVDLAVETTAPAKPIAPLMEDTIDALNELHMQLNGFETFLFGISQDIEERQLTKCLEDSAFRANGMAKYAVERIMQIKKRLGA